MPDAQSSNLTLGQRVCPDDKCHTHIFFIIDRDQDSKLVAAYPAERIDFDASNLPVRLKETFEEAITCHANACYVAAGMMVRKALEVLCEDKGAAGKTLQARLKELRTNVILPPPLLAALDDLRLLGNDAAHVESKDYDHVGKEEVEAAIELTKEILKAVYQYDDLLGRLQALKKSAGQASTT